MFPFESIHDIISITFVSGNVIFLNSNILSIKKKNKGYLINLNNNNNFKNSIDGKFLEENADGCNTYHYYIRYFELETIDGVSYLIGVATDYAEEYPDAPYIWKQNKNNELEIIGTSNIEKYSLNFELSK